MIQIEQYENLFFPPIKASYKWFENFNVSFSTNSRRWKHRRCPPNNVEGWLMYTIKVTSSKSSEIPVRLGIKLDSPWIFQGKNAILWVANGASLFLTCCSSFILNSSKSRTLNFWSRFNLKTMKLELSTKFAQVLRRSNTSLRRIIGGWIFLMAITGKVVRSL